MNVRAAAVLVLLRIFKDKISLTEALNNYLGKEASSSLQTELVIPRCVNIEGSRLTVRASQDKSFIKALCYGVCRWYFRLDFIAKKLLTKPLKTKDQDIELLILIGLLQLMEFRIPTHAAVSETVNALKDLKKIWAKGLVNGILREYLRQKDSIDQDILKNQLAYFSHPQWIIDKISAAYSSEIEKIMLANNAHPPFALRVNQNKISRENYLKKLTLDAQIIAETKNGIILKDAVDVKSVPGFSEGEISVQDGAAQLAAEILNPKVGERILDAAAAPGGKTAHLLEIADIELIAVDKELSRLEKIKENLKRLNLTASCIHADVADTQKWWDGKLFDAILVDAPCSATGVIRRHPDIKHLRQAADITKLADEQMRILNALWPLLKPNGRLLYATCSIFLDENVRIMEAFLFIHSDAKELKIQASWGKECEIGRQILPGMHDMDGFYYACLRKCA